MTYEKAFSYMWQGLLADGSMNMEAVAHTYEKHYGYAVGNPHRQSRATTKPTREILRTVHMKSCSA